MGQGRRLGVSNSQAPAGRPVGARPEVLGAPAHSLELYMVEAFIYDMFGGN